MTYRASTNNSFLPNIIIHAAVYGILITVNLCGHAFKGSGECIVTDICFRLFRAKQQVLVSFNLFMRARVCVCLSVSCKNYWSVNDMTW